MSALKHNRLWLGIFGLLVVALLFLVSSSKQEDENEALKIVVASNFVAPMKVLVQRFEKKTGHKVILSSGSTGKLYAQINHGAPFHAFFAADAEHPKHLEDLKLAHTGSRFTYAIGKIALWSPKEDFIDQHGAILESNTFQHLALANPELAPYGKAAQVVLQKKDLWNTLQSKLVRGSNIAQTYQFVESGHAELGFVAYSQLQRDDQTIKGSYWLVPPSLHPPIEQQAVILKKHPIVDEFMNFMQSQEALDIIRRFGYDIP